MRSNLPQHPCTNKCTDFKEEQCGHCLVQVMGTCTVIESDFLAGDVVVLAVPVTIQNRTADTDKLLTILSIDECCGLQVEVNGKRVYADASELRTATTAELKAKRRLPAPAALFIPQWGMDDLASVAEPGAGKRIMEAGE